MFKRSFYQKKGLEFEEKEYDEINSFCKKNNFICASAWDLNSLKFLKNSNKEILDIEKPVAIKLRAQIKNN